MVAAIPTNDDLLKQIANYQEQTKTIEDDIMYMGKYVTYDGGKSYEYVTDDGETCCYCGCQCLACAAGAATF